MIGREYRSLRRGHRLAAHRLADLAHKAHVTQDAHACALCARSTRLVRDGAPRRRYLAGHDRFAGSED
jgi:hypothetical protein